MKIISRVMALVNFAGFYLREMIAANLQLAWDVVTPTQHMRPAIIPLPLDAKSDFEILVLSNLLAMTPGTLCLDVSADGSVMYVHALYVSDESATRRELKAFEARMLKLLR